MSKILIIRFSSIGDIVLTTPVVRCIKQQLKGSEVHYVTKMAYKDMLSSNPYIDKLFTADDPAGNIYGRLRREKYDVVIDLHHNLRSFLFKTLLGIPAHSFHKLNIEKWLLVNFRINRLPHKHIVDRYFEAVVSLGVSNDGRGLDYFIPPADEVDTGFLPAAHRAGYTGFAIGAKYATKQLPPMKIAAICKKISTPIVLLGGEEDRHKGEEIVKEAGDMVFNACGMFSLNGSASLVKQAERIITHDTGLMHIAAALKKDIISIWGSTIPGFGMSPYLPDGHSSRHALVEVEGLSCRPCSKLGHSACPKGHFKCMNEISPETVAEYCRVHK